MSSEFSIPVLPIPRVALSSVYAACAPSPITQPPTWTHTPKPTPNSPVPPPPLTPTPPSPKKKARTFLIPDISGTRSLSENDDDNDGIWGVPAFAFPVPDDLVRQHIKLNEDSGLASGSRSAPNSTVPQFPPNTQISPHHHHPLPPTSPPPPPTSRFPFRFPSTPLPHPLNLAPNPANHHHLAWASRFPYLANQHHRTWMHCISHANEILRHNRNHHSPTDLQAKQ
ncbi:hypothetical protein EV359DRAFT_85683 [Lentinula novae-zelandiae]|nr:hypothetical protein EV359DRAFT_85683 [Lentinula novae-zelandiae]